jgi:hypothetical protein
MPLTRGRDSKGAYYRWGAAGARRGYTAGNKTSRERAKRKALAGSGRKTGGGRKPKKRPKTMSSAARAKRKAADKRRVRRVAAYRRPAIPKRQ